MNNTIKKILRILRCRSGFSLIELMLVCAIFGILAAAVGVYINTGKSEMKTFVFNQKAKFQMARFEAIKRGLDVYIDFDNDNDGNVDNGYTVWVDADNSGDTYVAWDAAVNDTNGNGECDTGDVGDCLIETVQFDNIISNPPAHGPEIYNPANVNGVQPGDVNGDGDDNGDMTDNGPDDKNIGNGVSAENERFRFSPNGDARPGSLYLYYPEGSAGAKTVNSGPWAIIVAPTGRVRIDRWGHMKVNDWDVDQ